MKDVLKWKEKGGETLNPPPLSILPKVKIHTEPNYVKVSEILIKNFTCLTISSEKLKTIKGHHCGIQVKGPHLTLMDPPFYS